jgi:formamidopyrimidine-DNA glycosylase
MPEGHTIHRLARDQAADLAGRPVAAVSPQGRFAEGAARLDGQVLRKAEAWGKHLFHTYDSGDILHVHLGLIGKFRRQPSPPADPIGLVRLRLSGPTATWDLSGPNLCALISPDEKARHVAGLGPDPLRANADPERFVARVVASDRPIADLLLDQAVIAGVGNVYRAELLFLSGLHPSTPGSALDEATARQLWDLTRAQLRLGLRRNRIVTRDLRELRKPLAEVSREESFYVYHQDGCRRCGEPLERLTVGGRRIDACPACQPRGGATAAPGGAPCAVPPDTVAAD